VCVWDSSISNKWCAVRSTRIIDDNSYKNEQGSFEQRGLRALDRRKVLLVKDQVAAEAVGLFLLFELEQVAERHVAREVGHDQAVLGTASVHQRLEAAVKRVAVQ